MSFTPLATGAGGASVTEIHLSATTQGRAGNAVSRAYTARAGRQSVALLSRIRSRISSHIFSISKQAQQPQNGGSDTGGSGRGGLGDKEREQK